MYKCYMRHPQSALDMPLDLIYLEEDVDTPPNLNIVGFEFIVNMPNVLGATILANQFGMQPFLVIIGVIDWVFVGGFTNC